MKTAFRNADLLEREILLSRVRGQFVERELDGLSAVKIRHEI